MESPDVDKLPNVLSIKNLNLIKIPEEFRYGNCKLLNYFSF